MLYPKRFPEHPFTTFKVAEMLLDVAAISVSIARSSGKGLDNPNK